MTKRIAAITPPRALVVLRFLLNTTEETDCFWPNSITLFYLNNYIRSAETGEIFGLGDFLEILRFLVLTRAKRERLTRKAGGPRRPRRGTKFDGGRKGSQATMARKVRIVCAGAFDHVINLGNDRSWIFESPGAPDWPRLSRSVMHPGTDS